MIEWIQVIVPTFFGSLGAAWVLLRWTIERQIKVYDDRIAENSGIIEKKSELISASIDELKREWRVEYGSILSKISTMEESIRKEQLSIIREMARIWETLPREYGRKDELSELRGRFTSLERKVDTGFNDVNDRIEKGFREVLNKFAR